MKAIFTFGPFLLALGAAIGNALVAVGQKKAPSPSNPFLFGSLTMGFAACILFMAARLMPQPQEAFVSKGSLRWSLLSAAGMVLLQIFLYFLYRNFGVRYYSLYSVLAMITTTIMAGIWVFDEPFTLNLGFSMFFAFVSIYFLFQNRL